MCSFKTILRQWKIKQLIINNSKKNNCVLRLQKLLRKLVKFIIKISQLYIIEKSRDNYRREIEKKNIRNAGYNGWTVVKKKRLQKKKIFSTLENSFFPKRNVSNFNSSIEEEFDGRKMRLFKESIV